MTPHGAPHRPPPPDRPDDTLRAKPGALPITVVVPAYTREALVVRALESIIAQTPCLPGEILVVDDCSGDRTAEAAREMGARVIRHERNLGEGAARNSGIEAAKFPWIALLDSDDEWLPHHLDTLWSRRDGHVLVAASALGCGADPDADRLHGWPLVRRPLVLTSPAMLLFPGNLVPASGGMVRRDVALRAGGYDPSLKRGADLDFLIRVLEQGSGVIDPTVSVIYHVHPGQVSTDRTKMRVAHTGILESYRDRPWWRPELVHRWSAVVAWDEMRLALRSRNVGQAVRYALSLLTRPRRWAGITQTWLLRLRIRRRSSSIGRDGRPSIVLLPSASGIAVDAVRASGRRVVDLSDAPRWRALFRVVRRPTGVAISGSRWEAMVLRAIGIATVRPGDEV